MRFPIWLRFILACAAVGAVVGVSSAQIATARPEITAELNRSLQAAVDNGNTAGVVVIAADRAGVIYQNAFGLAETGAGRAMTMDAIFRTASMTKAVTSAALMQLMEQGKVSLADPAVKFFPEFANPMVFASFDPVTHDYELRPARGTITVRHLLTHTSGLGYGFTSAILRDFKPREGESYPIGPLLFDPGTDWCYGTGVDWAGRLVEKLSGQSLEAYFQAHILGPLQMVDTSYNLPAAKHARLVNTYQRDANGGLTEQPRQAPREVTQFSGGGGLYSTAGDYVRFLQMLLRDGELDGVRVLKPETVALMERNHIGEVGARAVKSAMPGLSADFDFIADGRDKWSIGFQVTADAVPGKRSPGSLSWGGIFNTFFWLDPNREVAGVILMQSLPFADPRALEVYDAFERGVYKLIGP